MDLEKESWVFGHGFRKRELGFQPRFRERALTFSHLQLAHRDRELERFPFVLGDFCKERELGVFHIERAWKL